MDRMGGEEGEGEMYGESNIEIHNTICKIGSQWEFAVWLRDLKHGLGERLKGEVGRKMGGRSRREGTWVCLWLILVDVWQKTTKFYKAITFQLKNNKKHFSFWTGVQWMRSALGFLWKKWCWSWNSSTLATSCKALTHWKRLWCWEGLGARWDGDDRGWDGWMASLTRWTGVWVNSRSWWWTGRPGVLWFMGLQKVGHDWWLNWTEWSKIHIHYFCLKVHLLLKCKHFWGGKNIHQFFQRGKRARFGRAKNKRPRRW